MKTKATPGRKSRSSPFPGTAGAVAKVAASLPVLAWCSDLHLDHAHDGDAEHFLEELRTCKADLLLLGGDTSNARWLPSDLHSIVSAFPGKVCYVTGNHDYYGSGFSAVDDLLRNHLREAVRLDELAENGFSLWESSGRKRPPVHLLGVSGWGCGTAGVRHRTPVRLNDEFHIAELRGCAQDRRRLFAQMRLRAAKQTFRLRRALARAAAAGGHVVLLTHVPPWPGAAWHQGQNSDADFLPYFCNRQLGLMVSRLAREHPQTEFTVLCGHTHSEGFWRLGNIQVVTAAARYGHPRIYRIFPRAFWGWPPERREAWHRRGLGE